MILVVLGALILIGGFFFFIFGDGIELLLSVLAVMFGTCLIVVPLIGSDDTNEKRDAVEACISSGGNPEYTFDKRGRIVTYLGCVKP